jgi:hypothetical protein
MNKRRRAEAEEKYRNENMYCNILERVILTRPMPRTVSD